MQQHDVAMTMTRAEYILVARSVSHSEDNRGYELFVVSVVGGFSAGNTSAVASSLPAPSSLLLISCKVTPKLVLAWVAERRSSLKVAVLLVTVVNRLVT